MDGKVLLGISPGTRVIGLAIMHKGELVEWKVKSFKETWSIDKRNAILDTIHRICGYYGIQTIAIKKSDPLRRFPQLEMIVAAIIRQAKRNKIAVHECSLSGLDYDLQTGKKKTKDSISVEVVNKHPELRKKYLQERNNRADYYTKMFEAIAVAECLEE